MAKKEKPSNPWVISVGSGILVAVASAAITYYWTSSSISEQVVQVIEILKVDDTSQSLGQIAESCQKAVAALTVRAPRPATEIVGSLRTELTSLSDGIGKVKRSEMYTVEEITKLAEKMFMYSDKKAIIDEHLGKPKSMTSGLRNLKPHLARIDELFEALDRELEREPSIDIEGLRQSLAAIERAASATQAAVKARHDAMIQTLGKFGKKR
ncbi:MAG: hypothetical protein O7D91_18620 [Planctomycetota bacterium]|nr:hypothetical protein [Planctomycetota bacterium]